MNRELVDSRLAAIAFRRERRERVATAVEAAVSSIGDDQVRAILSRGGGVPAPNGTRPVSDDG
jgi:hypothetical protein